MSKLLWWDSQFCFQCQNFGDENLNFVSKCQKFCEAEHNLSHSAEKSVRWLTILSSRWLILGLWFFWDFGYYGTVVILGLRSLGLCVSNLTLKLLIEKTSCREKRNTIEQFLGTSVHADLMTTKRRTVHQKKFQSQTIRARISCGTLSRTFQYKCITRKFQLKTWPTGEKYSPILRIPTVLISTMKIRWSVSNFHRFDLNKSWAPSQKLEFF